MKLPKEKTILALDLGAKTGWAAYYDVYVGDSHVAIDVNMGSFISGVKDFSTKRFEGGGMRYLKFRKWLNIFYEGKDLSEIYFEEVNYSGKRNSSVTYGGFLATLTSWCEENKIPYQGVPVSTIKKYISGNGKSDKKAVIEAVRARGYDVQDDNEADALALLLYVKENKA
jgi:crossover junction endodeoxyribonuclease RuvC